MEPLSDNAFTLLQANIWDAADDLALRIVRGAAAAAEIAEAGLSHEDYQKRVELLRLCLHFGSAGSAREQIRKQKDDNDEAALKKVGAVLSIITKLGAFNRVLALLRKAGVVDVAIATAAGAANDVDLKLRTDPIVYQKDIEPVLRSALKLENKKQLLGAEREKLESILTKCELEFSSAEEMTSVELGSKALGRQIPFPLGQTVLKYYLRRDLLIRHRDRYQMEVEDLDALLFNGRITEAEYKEKMSSTKANHDATAKVVFLCCLVPHQWWGGTVV